MDATERCAERATRAAPPPRDRHSALTIALHWVSVLALLVATGAILWREAIEAPALRTVLMDTHRQAGLFVLLALAARLVLRLLTGWRDFASSAPVWAYRAATVAHASLYAVLGALTLLGWAGTSAHGVRLKLFGVMPLPALAGEDSDFADTLTDWHAWAAWALLALVAAHVAAALWHHFSQRDGVLAAMLPGVRRPAGRPAATRGSQ